MSLSTQRYRRTAGITGLLASFGCGWQLWSLMMWGVWGAPSNPLHLIALLGALALFISSNVLLSTAAVRAPVVSFVVTIPLWVFYAPACASSLPELLDGSGGLSLIPFLPPMLLPGSTAAAALAVRRQRSHRALRRHG